MSCTAGTVCSAMSCSVTCATGYMNCGGTCHDLQTDRLHCGNCTTTCAAGTVCSAGACTTSCGGTLTNCSSICRDTTTDRNNCGGCGNACAAGQICVGSSCVVSCPGSEMNCGGVCTDTANDRLHCGNCATTCAAGQICAGSVCTFSCPAGQVACGATPATTRCIDNLGGTPTCGSPINLGPVNPSTSASSPTRLQPTATTDWYVVNFPPMSPGGVPRILFSQNDGGAFVFDIVTSAACTGTLSCGTEGGFSSSRTDWQFSDVCGSAPNCSTRNVTFPTTIYIGVRRISPAPIDCSLYRLQVTR